MSRCSVALVALSLLLTLCYANAAPSPSEEVWHQDQTYSHITGTSSDSAYECNTDKVHVAEVLYNNIVSGSYLKAVKVTKELKSAGDGSLIRSVAMRLAREGNKNLLSYAYVLCGEERDICNYYMPDTLKNIFSGSVMLKHRKYDLPLKLGRWISPDGVRIPWGDGANNQPSTIKSWNLVPLWDNNQVFFLIQNVYRNMYLNMVAGNDTRWDNVGDKKVYSSNSAELPSHAWVLDPVVIGDDICFYITNVQFKQALKLQRSIDEVGDRLSWGHNGDIRKEPLHFAWSIRRPAVVDL